LITAGCVGYLVSIAKRKVVHSCRAGATIASRSFLGDVMLRPKQATAIVAVCLAMALWLVAGGDSAAAQSLPAAGRYQCSGTSGALPELNFVVGPGNIYTSARGWRDAMSVHPLSGNILFHGTTPQHGYQGRYASGPPAKIVLLTVTGGSSTATGITCQMN
jgi:hypothetical protein